MSEYPEYHEQAMGCGLEDQNITNRYEACRYGYETALEDVNNDIVEPLEKENKRLRELFRRYIDMWLDNEGVHFFDCMSKEDEKKLIEIREGGE